MKLWMASFVLALCVNFAAVASFTTSANTLPRKRNNNVLLARNNIISTTSSSHVALKMASGDEERTKSSNIDGSKPGSVFLAAVLLVNIWLFTIPTEFRRAHIYPEGNAALYSDPRGTTANDWVAGVAQYYANGGGVKFDFSVEGRE